MAGRPEAEPGLYRKLVWATAFRVVTVTVLLGGAAVVGWEARGEAEEALAPLYAVIIGSYAGSIATSFALRARRWLVQTAYAHITLDVALAAALVAITGGSESVFLFMFSLAVVGGAVLLFRPGAVAAAMLAVAGYLAAAAIGGRAAPGTLFAHCGAFIATAVLASYLAEQLRTTGERLSASEGHLAAITALHESIVQSMTSGLMTLDGAGAVTFLNHAGALMTGRSAVEAVGLPAAEVLPAFQLQQARDEFTLRNARGEDVRIGYSSFPLRGREGEDIGSAVIFQDLTRFRAMEEAVQRSERLADLGRVAAGLAHELRNPLASMSGSVELLRAAAPADADERRLLDIVLREASRLNHLVTDFLQFARPAPPRPEPVDLAVLLDETLRVFSHDPAAAGVQLERQLASAPIRADPGQLRQVAWNLLLNAAQAVAGRPGTGRLRVSCEALPAGGAVFAVEDDGPGIPPAERARVFLPFHTTKEGGTGLGLATVQRIVDAHGGRVEVGERAGGGAVFQVTLPATEAVAAAAAG